MLPFRNVLLSRYLWNHQLFLQKQEGYKKTKLEPYLLVGRIKGTALYIGGLFIMIVIRLPFMSFIGFCVQISGIIVVFRDFLPWLKSYTFAIPVVGKYLSTILSFRNKFFRICHRLSRPSEESSRIKYNSYVILQFMALYTYL